jgi:circadian clock protein KaiC
VSFDSDPNEVIRDLGSVGIRLAPHVKSGVLRMASARNITGSAETYLMRIKTLANGAQGALPRDRPGVDVVQVGQRAGRAQRDRAADRLDQGEGHHAAVHEPARRDVDPDRRGTAATDSPPSPTRGST